MKTEQLTYNVVLESGDYNRQIVHHGMTKRTAQRVAEELNTECAENCSAWYSVQKREEGGYGEKH